MTAVAILNSRSQWIEQQDFELCKTLFTVFTSVFSDWKLSLWNQWTPGNQKWSLFCLASIDTTLWITISLALITSFELSPEQTRMKSKFFLLSAWSSITDRCDFRHNQLSIVRFSFIFVRRTLFENLFLNFVYLNSAWEVAMVVSSQFKTMKPHLWHIQVIPYVHRNFLWNANMGVGIATDYCHFVQDG